MGGNHQISIEKTGGLSGSSTNLSIASLSDIFFVIYLARLFNFHHLHKATEKNSASAQAIVDDAEATFSRGGSKRRKNGCLPGVMMNDTNSNHAWNHGEYPLSPLEVQPLTIFVNRSGSPSESPWFTGWGWQHLPSLEVEHFLKMVANSRLIPKKMGWITFWSLVEATKVEQSSKKCLKILLETKERPNWSRIVVCSPWNCWWIYTTRMIFETFVGSVGNLNDSSFLGPRT